MRPYADTNFLTAVLCGTRHSSAAEALQREAVEKGARPFPVIPLLRLELTNALQRMVFLSKQSAEGIHFTREQALLAEHAFLEELSLGALWTPTEVSVTQIEQEFTSLVYRHTSKHGFRTYDILHVAFALSLGCDTFWSFDEKAKKLAGLEGLKTN